MGLKEYITIIELEKEVKQLRAEKFIAQQRQKEAEDFIHRIACDLELSRIAAANVPVGYRSHPALIAYNKRQSAFELVDYLYQIFTGHRA